MKSLLEIRTYTPKLGTYEDFHRIMQQESLPLLERWKVDVVSFGPSS